MKRLFYTICLALSSLTLSVYTQSPDHLSDYNRNPLEHMISPTETVESLNYQRSQPAVLIENHGQWNKEARFLMRGSNVNIWVSDHGFVYDFYRNHYATSEKEKRKRTYSATDWT